MTKKPKLPVAMFKCKCNVNQAQYVYNAMYICEYICL